MSAPAASRVFAKHFANGVIGGKNAQLNRSHSTASTGILLEDRMTYDDIPGPKSYPIIKNIYKFLPGGSWYGHTGLDFLQAMHGEYGNIVRIHGIMGRNNMAFLFLPEHIEKVYRMESQNPTRPGLDSLGYFRKNIRNDIFQFAPGLLVTHGKEWRNFRSKINAPMLQPRIVKFYTRELDQVALDMISRLKRLRNEENRIDGDFGHEMNLWALESIAAVALGSKIGCLRDDLPSDALPNQLIESVKDIFNLTYELDGKPSMWTVWPTESYKKLMAAFELQLNISQHYINKFIDSRDRDTQDCGREELSILGKLLAIDKKVAVAMANDMLLAGVDTSANTIVGILYYLAKNQTKQDKLRNDVNEAFANEQEIGQIPYLKACIKESMRLFPIAGLNARTLTNDIELGGYHIPKQTDMVFAHQFVAVSADQFVKPLEFAPERWLKEECDMKTSCTHAFANVPFGFGSRSCPGRRIAQLELQIFLARLVSTFRVEWNGPPIKSASATLNYFTAPYNFVFHDV